MAELRQYALRHDGQLYKVVASSLAEAVTLAGLSNAKNISSVWRPLPALLQTQAE